jgi:HD domain
LVISLPEKASQRPKSAGSKLCVFYPNNAPHVIPTFPLAFADLEEFDNAQEAMQNFVHEMLHDSPAALKIMSLWEEYEDQSTAEARFVKGA